MANLIVMAITVAYRRFERQSVVFRRAMKPDENERRLNCA